MPLQDPKKRCKLPSGREWKCKPPNDPMDSREQGTLGPTPGPRNNRVKSVDSRPEVPNSHLSLSLKVNSLSAFLTALLLPGPFRAKWPSAGATGPILSFAPHFPFHKFVTHPRAPVTHFLRVIMLGAMKECFGVGCKNRACGVNIPLGLYEGGAVARKTTWHKLDPTVIECPACHQKYEYGQGDVVRFPCP